MSTGTARPPYAYRPRSYPPRPCWVNLGRLLVRDPQMPRHENAAGIRMHGEVPGILGHWIPTVDGHWLGRVDYTVAYDDGREPLRLHDQLIPAYALRPRDTRAPRR